MSGERELEFVQLVEKWMKTNPKFTLESDLPMCLAVEFYRLGVKHGKYEILEGLEPSIKQIKIAAIENVHRLSNASNLMSEKIEHKLTQVSDLLKSIE